MAIEKKILGFITIHRRPKDGEKGDPGRDGSNYLIMGWWDPTISYKLSDAGIPVVKVEDDSDDGFSVYKLVAESATIGLKPPNDEWEKVQSAEFIHMQNAYIQRLQAILVTAEKIESMMIRTKNIEILEGAVVKGTLDGVTGSFKKLNCVDSYGNVIGSLSFGTDGRFWFENCSIAHQAATGPFLSSDIWVRGVLGSRGRTALVVSGTSYGYVYKNGLAGGSQYISLASGIDSSGNTYYNIPLYSPTTESSGMPIDLVIINHSSAARYNLPSLSGKLITIVNSNDKNSNIYIYANGVSVRLDGGTGANLACVGKNQNPDNSSWLGRGWIVTGLNDNNWG